MVKLLSDAEVSQITGYSRVTLWRKRRDGSFPKALKLGANKLGYLQTEIEAWIAARPRA